MTDLINRADAIEAVKDIILKRFNLADWYEEMLNCGTEIEDRIKALPSADAVEVVRCKDCKWREHIGCALSIADDRDKPKDNDFCSFGERKEP